MRILETLKSIIIEQVDHENLLFLTPNNETFYSSVHNSIERLGNQDYETIRYMILKSIDSNVATHERVAIPNEILSQVIGNKYEKIINSFKGNSPGDRIKFVYKNEDNKHEEVFDYLEFIVSKSKNSRNRYVIPTSTYSDTGNYLRFFNKFKNQQKKVMLENYFHIKTVTL
jgi:hypothetical protein